MSKDGQGVTTPAPASNPWFSVALFGDWEETYNGSAVGGVDNLGNSKVVSGHVHDIQFGTRPTIWLTDNIALQGQFSGNCESNNINGSGYAGFGKPGWLGVFDVGPVIKPKGGYYTKPELRFFATYGGMVLLGSQSGVWGN